MIKKTSSLLLCFFLFYPLSAFAFTVYEVNGIAIKSGPYYSPSDDKYIVEFDPNIVRKVVYGSYTDATFSTPMTVKVRELGENEYFYGVHYFTCNSYYKAEYFDGSGTLVGTVKFHATELVNPTCNSDTSLGNGGSGGGSGSCAGCDLFNCPGWSQYMGKLDEIKNAIPPAPNWNQVAVIFRDTIVPKLVADLEVMLGTAPSPPAEPPDLPGVDTHGIEDKVPSMPDSGLDTSGFTKDRIESEAPEIEFREDESGGFDIVNPIDTLPPLPDKMPEPGNTDAGGWDAGHPQEPEDAPMPIPKDQDGTPELGDAPIPSENNDAPPSPEDDSGNPPTPQDDEMQGTKYYKKHPDDPDGSG
ncbi:MAG: hypothetical protein CW346_02740 [Bacillaceae bacterium]|nr:hypothetical protein [Bacillaceae bacterium]